MRSRVPAQFLRSRIVIAILLLLSMIAIYLAISTPVQQNPGFTPPPPIPTNIVAVTSTPIAIATPSPTVNDLTPTITPAPNSIIFTIPVKENDIGWVQSDETIGNHFGESYLYAGLRDGRLSYGVMQFDLLGIPANSTVTQAELVLTGLDSTGLLLSNSFNVNILADTVDKRWTLNTYETINNAELEPIPSLILQADELGNSQENRFVFNAAIRGLIEDRLKTGAISFRLESVTPTEEGWFAWDTGYGISSNGNRPTLRLGVILPEIEALAENDAEDATLLQDLGPLIIITSTPTPENQLTAVAIGLTVTYESELDGPATSIPLNWVTPWVISASPTPENQATAEVAIAEATLIATVYGTPTPTPENIVTATPTPTFLVITSTPTPKTIFTAVAIMHTMTMEAVSYGSATTLPENWVTPFVVTSTPTPVTEATKQYLEASYLTTGTPTSLPANVQTATSTPIYVLLDGEIPPMTATPTPTFTPGPIPSELIGKIAFKADFRTQKPVFNLETGRVEAVFDEDNESEIFVINPDGTELAILSNPWPYELAKKNEQYSLDGRFRVFTKDVIRYRNLRGKIETITIIDDDTGEERTVEIEDKPEVERVDAPGLYWYDAHYNVEEQLTYFGSGIAYGGVWSPTREQIAFISTDSGNDEIWVVNRDGSNLLQLTRDDYHMWDKHPSWSPDGEKIVFWSNRTGHAQIWVMDRDGGNLYSLSRTGFNNWDPVWIKTPSIPNYIPPN